ncbi:MAG: response regulator [bacterium]
MNKLANILICDDSNLIRKQLRNTLEKEKHTVFETTSLKQIKGNTFSGDITLKDINLVFLDIYLKNDSGFQILSYLKDNQPDIPVIMISVDNKKKIIFRALIFGAVDYILKPFDEKLLIEKTNKAL